MLLKTDYSQVSNLLLAYPENFQNEYEELVPFYDLLLTKIPHEIQLHIIVNNESSKRKLACSLRRVNRQVIVEKDWNEIWVRDIFGIPAIDRIFKPKYAPNYCGYLNSARDFEKLNSISKTIAKDFLKQRITDLPLVLDGGNFVTNGKLALLTDKVVRDNGGDQEKIKEVISGELKVQPIFLSIPPGDNVAHSDGYMAFIGESTIGLSSYPEQDLFKYDNSWLRQVDAVLRSKELMVVPFHERPSSYYIPCKCEESRRRKCCTETANGVYINFLRLNSTIILPEYSMPTLKEADYFNHINEAALSKLGFQVIKIKSDLVAAQGGVLRCLSFTF